MKKYKFWYKILVIFGLAFGLFSSVLVFYFNVPESVILDNNKSIVVLYFLSGVFICLRHYYIKDTTI